MEIINHKYLLRKLYICVKVFLSDSMIRRLHDASCVIISGYSSGRTAKDPRRNRGRRDAFEGVLMDSLYAKMLLTRSKEIKNEIKMNFFIMTS